MQFQMMQNLQVLEIFYPTASIKSAINTLISYILQIDFIFRISLITSSEIILTIHLQNAVFGDYLFEQRNSSYICNYINWASPLVAYILDINLDLQRMKFNSQFTAAKAPMGHVVLAPLSGQPKN